ncbi:MAG: 30S ribosomal protein S4 [archaeon]|nr:MAG: 30S ribosomal protein S4 [archaeon]
MGDPKRSRKRYARPKRPYDSTRISEEKNLLKKYGLKNRREIWTAEAKLKKFRNEAKKLILNPEKQEEFLKHLNKLGLIEKDANIDDVLALTKEKILDRRFQTVVLKKKLSKSVKQARQLITHKKVKIGKSICNVPGRIIKVEEESKIALKNG